MKYIYKNKGANLNSLLYFYILQQQITLTKLHKLLKISIKAQQHLLRM